MIDLHTARGIALFVLFIGIAILGVWLIQGLISLVIINKKLRKMAQALEELGTMPLDEWEAKWREFVQKEYNKCDDPHRQEVEENMAFFRKELEELKKGGKQ